MTACWTAPTVGMMMVTGISLDRSKKAISLNDTEQLTATISPANTLNKLQH